MVEQGLTLETRKLNWLVSILCGLLLAACTPITADTLPSESPVLTTNQESTPATAAEQKSLHTLFLSSLQVCELPCWFGFEPGISTEDDIHAFFSEAGLQEIEYQIDEGLRHDYSIEQIFFSFQTDESVLQRIEVDIYINSDSAFYDSLTDLHSQVIAEQYGAPQESFIVVPQNPEPAGFLGYSTFLFYFERGFVILEEGILIDSQVWPFCLNNHLPRRIVITVADETSLMRLRDEVLADYSDEAEVIDALFLDAYSTDNILTIQENQGCD